MLVCVFQKPTIYVEVGIARSLKWHLIPTTNGLYVCILQNGLFNYVITAVCHPDCNLIIITVEYQSDNSSK